MQRRSRDWCRHAAQRSGDLPTGVVTPVTQAQDLLKLYPLPNVSGNSLYNYQVPVITDTHQDALQSRLDKTIGNKNQFYGGFAFQSIRSSGSNLFGFLDTTDTLGINANVNWAHRFSHELFLTTGYKFSRLRTQVTPNFANRTQRLRRSRHHRQQPGSRQLGPANACFFQRNRHSHRRAKRL